MDWILILISPMSIMLFTTGVVGWGNGILCNGVAVVFMSYIACSSWNNIILSCALVFGGDIYLHNNSFFNSCACPLLEVLSALLAWLNSVFFIIFSITYSFQSGSILLNCGSCLQNFLICPSFINLELLQYIIYLGLTLIVTFLTLSFSLL